MEEQTAPVTTKSLATDGGLDEILKKIEGIGLDDPLTTLGAMEPAYAPPRMDNDPQVFLGTGANKVKGGEAKPLLIPDFVNGQYYGSIDEDHELGSSGGTSVILRASTTKPKLENVSLSMWVAANSRIMNELMTSGKVTGKFSVSDYLAYTVKVAELLESHTLISVLQYDNEYRKLQHKFSFRWGSDSQHLHTRFLVKRRNTISQSPQKSQSGRNRQQQVGTPICKQFNTVAGCQWPNCRFQHVCLVPDCNIAHPQYQHNTQPNAPRQ